MRIVAGSAALPGPLRRAALTVGNFDGLHVGHRAIMATVVERARALGGEAAVYTFEPHPRRVLRPDVAPRLLTTLEQKLELLERLEVDVAIVEPFDAEFARTSAERFVREILHARLAPREVYVGHDFHFGRDREGSMRTLTELGPDLGFAVTIIPEVKVRGRDVNSTRIRELLGEGRVEDAAELLARPYAVRGRVVAGDRRGRGLGFPTANLHPENEILPAVGVYAGRVCLLDEGTPAPGCELPAVTNVGRRPTFKASAPPSGLASAPPSGLASAPPSGLASDPVLAEAHLLDFDADLYGRRVELLFLHHLRAERRFPDVEALRRQIASDVEEARRRLAGP